jgi:hypothetical protein
MISDTPRETYKKMWKTQGFLIEKKNINTINGLCCISTLVYEIISFGPMG